MIIDSLANSDKYVSLHPLLAPAFEYLKATDLNALEPAKYEIQAGLPVGVTDKPAMTAAESAAKFECHNNNIDIQLCIRGTETIGWKPRGDCQEPKGEYNPEKDVLFYNDAPDMHFVLKAGQFAIFFPEDVHAPMIGEGNIKKAVVKVKI